MLGLGEPVSTMPWSWSDPYELSIKLVGLPGSTVRSVERTTEPAATMAFFFKAGDRLLAAGAIGPGTATGRDIELARAMIKRRLCLDLARLQDPASA